MCIQRKHLASVLLQRAGLILHFCCCMVISFSGDVSKIPIPPTNHQAAYGAHPPDLSPPNHSSRRAQALAQIHSSSSHPYVCDPRINPFQHSPVPHPSSPALDHLPAAGHPPMIQVDMTTSHFSQGDLNSERVEERINYSTAQKSHRPVSMCLCTPSYEKCANFKLLYISTL